jgi:hypothetical protein
MIPSSVPNGNVTSVTSITDIQAAQTGIVILCLCTAVVDVPHIIRDIPRLYCELTTIVNRHILGRF